MTNFYGITKLTLDEIIQRDPEHSCRNECAHAQFSTARPAITKQQLEEWAEHESCEAPACVAYGAPLLTELHGQRRDLARALRAANERIANMEDLWGFELHADGPQPTTRKRGTYLPVPQVFALSHVAMIVGEAFGEVCYLVGSALERRDYRDVDVRMIFSDAKWAALFGEGAASLQPFWSLVCAAVSEYMAARCGLPIDFQIQRHSDVTPEEWKKPRNPLGLWYGKSAGPAWMRSVGG